MPTARLVIDTSTSTVVVGATILPPAPESTVQVKVPTLSPPRVDILENDHAEPVGPPRLLCGWPVGSVVRQAPPPTRAEVKRARWKTLGGNTGKPATRRRNAAVMKRQSFERVCVCGKTFTTVHASTVGCSVICGRRTKEAERARNTQHPAL